MFEFFCNNLRIVIIRWLILTLLYFITFFTGSISFWLIMTGGVVYFCSIITGGVTILGKSVFTVAPETFPKIPKSVSLDVSVLVHFHEFVLILFPYFNSLNLPFGRSSNKCNSSTEPFRWHI